MPEEVVRSTESIVAGALKDADLPTDPNEIISDADEVHADPDIEADVDGDEKPVVEVKEGEEKPPVVEGDVDDDPELTKLMEEYGIKRPTKEQKDNRIPYSRQRKIIGKMVKGIHAKHQADLETRDTKVTAAEAELKNFRNADALAGTDPERYIAALSVIHPGKYDKWTKAEVKAEVKKIEQKADEPAPGPDLKYSDGTTGYSEEQWAKRDTWLVNKAKADALAEVAERLGPIEKERAAIAANEKNRPMVVATLNRLKDQWGDLFLDEYKKDGDSEILKVMKAEGLSMDAACVKVLLPRKLATLQTDREKLRAEIIDELSKRSDKQVKAAQKSAPAAVKKVVDDEEHSTEDVVRAAMASAGMRG